MLTQKTFDFCDTVATQLHPTSPVAYRKNFRGITNIEKKLTESKMFDISLHKKLIGFRKIKCRKDWDNTVLNAPMKNQNFILIALRL